MRTREELLSLKTFLERYRYLKMSGKVGEETFGRDRYLNQFLYSSPEWRRLRNQIILRDNACDLAMQGYDIPDRIYIHHINPISVDDFKSGNRDIYDPENLICTSFKTHQAIHYGDERLLGINDMVIRKPNDTIPWR